MHSDKLVCNTRQS